MFLSIVIPIWNDEKYLNECLDSCLNQELPRDEYEIICVDDGSTDRTPEILREYAEKYSNIKMITKEHGKGSGRMIGMEAAKGDYLWFADHDDFLAPHAVDDLRQVTLEHEDYDRIQFPGYKFMNSLTGEELKCLLEGRLQQNFTFPPIDWFAWSSIVKMSFLHDKQISPQKTRISDAALFWGKNDFRIWGGDWVFINECKDMGCNTFFMSGRPLYHYRIHESSSTLLSTPEAIENRANMRYNMALYRGWLAWDQKQKYLAERTEYGRASVKTTEKLMLKIRDAVSFLSMQTVDQWRKGLRQFKEKDIFLKRRPEEDTYSFRDYWKGLNKKEKILPHLLTYYFCYTKFGVSLFSFFVIPYKLLSGNRLTAERKKAQSAKRLIEMGTGKSS